MVLSQVFVYQIPPRASNKGASLRRHVGQLSGAGHVAAQWNLEKPVWRGRMRITSKGVCALSAAWSSRYGRSQGLDRPAGQQHRRAVCRLPRRRVPRARGREGAHTTHCVGLTDGVQVTDSSRYFVLRLVHESGACPPRRCITHHHTGKHAFIGMGFTDRGDAFDFTVALQDHFKCGACSIAIVVTVCVGARRPRWRWPRRRRSRTCPSTTCS